MPQDIVTRIQAALPRVRLWIENYKARHESEAIAVGSLGFKRLGTCFPMDLLARAKVVTVPKVPYPPLDQFDLPEFAPLQQMAFDGITFDDTFYLEEGRTTESLHFHELIHVIQWGKLGLDKFLLSYGIGLIQHGYENSPLEAMAYRLQAEFDRGTTPPRLIELVESETATIWNRVAAFLQAR